MSSKSSTDADISLLKQSISHLDNVLSSLESLAKSKPWSKLGYFDATQHDTIEHLYFRFLVSRGVLVSLALPQGNSTDNSLKNALEKAESLLMKKVPLLIILYIIHYGLRLYYLQH